MSVGKCNGLSPALPLGPRNQHRLRALYLHSPLGRFAKVERRKGGVEAQCFCQRPRPPPSPRPSAALKLPLTKKFITTVTKWSDRLRPGVTILQVILYHTQPGGTLISKAALVRLTPLTLNFSPNSRLKETQCRTGRSTST